MMVPIVTPAPAGPGVTSRSWWWTLPLLPGSWAVLRPRVELGLNLPVCFDRQQLVAVEGYSESASPDGQSGDSKWGSELQP